MCMIEDVSVKMWFIWEYVKQYDWFFASEDLLIITVIWHQIFIEPAVETNMSFPLKTMMLKTFVCVWSQVLH